MAIQAIPVRKAITLSDITDLQDDLEAWSADWGPDDPRQNCRTHVNAFKAALVQAVTEQHDRALAIAGEDPGEVSALLRRIDAEVGALRALWGQLRDRVEARAEPTRTAVLRAADELVWSTHRGASIQMKSAGMPTPPPVPLVSIVGERVAEMHPSLFVRKVTPSGSSEVATRLCQRLGVREVLMLDAARTQPWLLAIVLHEAGHALERDMQPQRPVLALLAPAIGAAMASSANAQAWSNWSREILADAVAVAAAGPAILPALHLFEATAAQRLAEPGLFGSVYPPPLARWELARAYGAKLGLPMDALAAPPPPEVEPMLRELIGEIPGIVEALMRPLPEVGKAIHELWPDTAALFAQKGAVEVKRAQLRGAGPLPADGSMSGARAAIAALVLEAEELFKRRASGDVADLAWRMAFRKEQQRLASRGLDVLGACHGPGVRAATSAIDVADAGKELNTWLGALWERDDA